MESNKTMSDTFTCAKCKGTFYKAWTDEEAEQELKENFPGQRIEECDIVCDNCYELLWKER